MKKSYLRLALENRENRDSAFKQQRVVSEAATAAKMCSPDERLRSTFQVASEARRSVPVATW